MKKPVFIKKFYLFSVASVFFITATVLSGCSNYSGINETLPDFSDSSVITRTAWWCPEPTEENYKTYAECELNNVMLASNNFMSKYDDLWSRPDLLDIYKKESYYVGTPSGFSGKTKTDIALELAKANNLTVYVAEGQGLFNGFDNPISVYDDFKIDYSDYEDVITGLFVGDEPATPTIAEYAKNIPKAQQYFPNVPYFCNLYPYYADAKTHLKTDNYMTYINTYCEQFLSKLTGPRILSIDYYPFQAEQFDMWLYNYDLVAKKAIEYNADFHTFIQSCLGTSRWAFMELSDNDMRLQVNTSLAYGSTSYAYFLYTPASGGFDIGLIGDDGKPSNMYYQAQAANKETKALENAYTHYDYVCTSPISNDSEDYNVGAFSAVASCKNEIFDNTSLLHSVDTNNRILVTLLKDEMDNEAYYIVNFYDKNDEEKEEDATIKLSFSNMNYVSVSGTKKCLKNQTSKISNDTYEFTLAPGEGALVIPYNK